MTDPHQKFPCASRHDAPETAGVLNVSDDSPFEQVLAALPVILWESDWSGPDGAPRLTYVSHSAERILGYPMALWLGDPEFVPSIFHPDDRDAVLRFITSGATASLPPVYHFRCLASDGRVLWLEGRSAPVRDAEGRVIGLRGVNIDVTDRIQAEEALRNSEARYRRITEASAEGVLVIDAHGHPTYINRRVTELLGYTLDDVRDRHVFEIMDRPDERLRAFEKRRPGWDRRKSYQVRLRHRDNSLVWVSVVVSLDYREDGSFDGALCLLTDITEQKRATDALYHIESQYRLLAETTSDVLTRFDRNLCCLYASPSVENILGLPPSQLVGRVLSELNVSHEQVAFWDRQIELVLNTGLEHYVEFERTKGGDRRQYQTVLMPERADDGSVSTCILLTRDVTERRKLAERQKWLAEATVSLSRSLEFEVIIQNVTRLAVPYLADGCVVFIFEDDGTARAAAAAHVAPEKEGLLRRLRYQQQVAGAPSGEPGDGPETGVALDTWIPGAARDEEQSQLLAAIGVSSSIAVPLTARGRVIGGLVLLRGGPGPFFEADDLSFADDMARRAAMALDNARLYQEVRRMNQAKDEFLALLSHELRNPLAAIRNALEAASLDTRPAAFFKEVQTELTREVQGMSRLVDDLLDVARITRGRIHLRPEPHDIFAAVRAAAESVRLQMHQRNHVLVLPEADGPLMVHADPVRLEQVVRNLLSNAAKYTPAKGRIVVRVEREEGMAVLRCADNGIGIEPATLPLLFRTFYQVDSQRDAAQEGLGLGLSLVRSLVEMHGGTVEARSEGIGRGSEFIARWPLAEVFGDAPDAAPATEALPSARRAEPRRILLVEDNVFSARMLSHVLSDSGHAVRLAADGPAALAAVAEERPDVIILDIGLPKMDGYEVARRLRMMPEMEEVLLVALTGYGREEDVERSRSSGFDHHFTKPVDFDALLGLLTREPARDRL